MSGDMQKRRFLSPSRISELVWDSESEDTATSSDSPSEHLAVDEVIVKYKGRVIFRQYIPKKHKRFGIKIYKLCDETGYTKSYVTLKVTYHSKIHYTNIT